MYAVRITKTDGSRAFRWFTTKTAAQRFYTETKFNSPRWIARIGIARIQAGLCVVRRDLDEEETVWTVEDDHGRVLADFGHGCELRKWMDAHGLGTGSVRAPGVHNLVPA